MSGSILDALDVASLRVVELKFFFDANHQWAQAGVLWVFATLNSVRIIAYVPQVMKAARDKNGAAAVSLITWGLFFASHVTTVLYALICLGDLLMGLLFIGNAIACLAIFATTVFKRRAHRRFEIDTSPTVGSLPLGERQHQRDPL